MIRLRPDDQTGTRCDVAGCQHDYAVRYVAGADEHRARARDVRLCDRDLERYGRELDELRDRARARYAD